MATFASILATTDLSGHAREAVLRAGRIARDTGAALHLVHVQQVAALDQIRNLLGNAPADLRTRLENAARFGVEELADALARDYGVKPALRCAEGGLIEEIMRAGKETSADLVVFGARGASVARHLLLDARGAPPGGGDLSECPGAGGFLRGVAACASPRPGAGPRRPHPGIPMADTVTWSGVRSIQEGLARRAAAGVRCGCA